MLSVTVPDILVEVTYKMNFYSTCVSHVYLVCISCVSRVYLMAQCGGYNHYNIQWNFSYPNPLGPGMVHKSESSCR